MKTCPNSLVRALVDADDASAAAVGHALRVAVLLRVAVDVVAGHRWIGGVVLERCVR